MLIFAIFWHFVVAFSTEVEIIPVLGFFTRQCKRKAISILAVFRGAILMQRELIIIGSRSQKK